MPLKSKAVFFACALAFGCAACHDLQTSPLNPPPRLSRPESPVSELAESPQDEAHLICDSALADHEPFQPEVSTEFAPSVNHALARLLEFINSEKTETAPSALGHVPHVLPDSSRQFGSWIGKRIKNLFFGEEDLRSTLMVSQTKFTFPYLNPEVSFVENPLHPPERAPRGANSVSATNIGAQWYFESKSKSELWARPTDNGESQVLTSPRVGWVMIGRALFASPLRLDFRNGDRESNLVAQAAVLFHEARHSDGHGAHLGMPHAICPKGHDYEGVAACDQVANGAYKVGSEFIERALQSCDSCTESDKQFLGIQFLEQLNRLTDLQRLPWVDARPETAMPVFGQD